MANQVKTAFLEGLTSRFGSIRKLDRSQSLFEVEASETRIYVRFSKVHDRQSTFYGLRQDDLLQLQGRNSFICFLWDSQTEPLLIPFAEYERVFNSIQPARDGQYKAQVFLRPNSTELYIANAGRFSADAHFGWVRLESAVRSEGQRNIPELSHPQVQTLLGAIGIAKGYEVWVPLPDRLKLDWSLARAYRFRDLLPSGLENVRSILEEVDVIWLDRGSSALSALFEVEHSTPIYSGLLRLNDVYLGAPHFQPTFAIVANDTRRDLFVRQLNRPTFQTSGLSRICTFFNYAEVFVWHERAKTN